nr:hypothetical protein A8713_034005 [Streptomyces sp. SAT1]
MDLAYAAVCRQEIGHDECRLPRDGKRSCLAAGVEFHIAILVVSEILSDLRQMCEVLLPDILFFDLMEGSADLNPMVIHQSV